MAISSLGAGSGLLTQDVLDQLRAADESAKIVPIDLSTALENDKKDAMKIIDSNMENLIDSITAIKTSTLFDDRQTTVTGDSVSVTALSNSDIQDFTLDVTVLATKQIEQSGAFSSESFLVASEAGTMKLNIDGQDFEIAYDETTTLKDLKNLINEEAGEKVDATIVQINSGEFRLFVSSADTGTSQDITITDNSGFLLNEGGTTGDTRLTLGMTQIQGGVDAEFTFNGQAITRSSNEVDDLISGLTINLLETGSSSVSVAQDRDGIVEKFDNFVKHYNAAIVELEKMTKPSVDSDERGIFSNESTIKNMKRVIEDLYSTVGGDVSSLNDYGFDVDVDGKMTFDKDVLITKLDENPNNVEAFFTGGTYTHDDGSTTELDGAFVEYGAAIEVYTGYNATLDLFTTSITDKISDLEDKKEIATKRLDDKYEIMAKQWASYDLIINQLNSASSMFAEMVNTEY